MEFWDCPICSPYADGERVLIKYGTTCIDLKCSHRVHLNVNGLMYAQTDEQKKSESLGISQISDE
jgi:hypothetical protein